MKKLFALVLALTMVMSLATTAFATEPQAEPSINAGGTTTITVPNVNNRDFEGYMLMEVSVKYKADGVTPDGYGYAVNDKYKAVIVDVLNALDAAKYPVATSRPAALTTSSSDTEIVERFRSHSGSADRTAAALKVAQAMLDAIKADASLTPDVKWNTKADPKFTVDQGYWLFEDVTDLTGRQIEDANGNVIGYETNSLVLAATLGVSNLELRVKINSTSLVKQVDDENDSLIDSVTVDGEDGYDYGKIADYDIGDHVPYSITTTLAGDAANYKYYSIRIIDEASKGLKYDEPDGTADGPKILVSFNTIYDVDSNGDPVYKFYEAVKAGSAEANDSAAHPFLYSIETFADGTSKLVVFPNQGYTTNKTKEWKDATVDNGGDILPFLKANIYMNKKPGEAGYEDDLATKINQTMMRVRYTAELTKDAVIVASGNPNDSHAVVSSNPNGDTFGETPDSRTVVLTFKLRVNKVDDGMQPLDGAEFTLSKFYARGNKQDDPNWVFHAAAGAWGEWVVVPGVENNTPDDPATTDKNEATFGYDFTGLDDGFYLLEETVVPPGYNPIDPIYFQLIPNLKSSFDVKTDKSFLSSLITVGQGGHNNLTGVIETGTLTANIQNHSGAQLPATGGTGTTVMYIAGAALVMFAVVMLITKKRMSVEG